MAFQGSLFDTVDEVGLRSLGAEIRRTTLAHGAWIDLRPGWLTGADELFSRLARDVPWHAERRKMYDREVDVPRLLSFYDEEAQLPDPLLGQARSALSAHYAAELGEPFRTVGLCFYRDGRDSVAWHGDRIGRGSTEDTLVAIASVGAPSDTTSASPRRRWPYPAAPAGPWRPARHGRVVPADLGARHSQDSQAGRTADQHPVQAARCRLTDGPTAVTGRG